VAHQSSVLPHPLLKDAGASRRSTAAISDPQVRVSWFPSRFLLPIGSRGLPSAGLRNLRAVAASDPAITSPHEGALGGSD
jgi:hypothetical protein